MILDRFRLDGQVAVVTGAGRGLGAAMALAFAEAGADVVIAARTRSQLEEVAAQIEATGRRAHVVVADLARPDDTATLADRAVEVFGKLDIVVNNVGGTMPNALLSTSTKDMRDAFTFNVATAHALTTAAVPLMLEHSGGGSVINITSTMGRLAGRGFAAYGTAKAAL
ncbi:MAG TPA: SDR family NAD(P)-dependent oxidoreductase, partial [Mycobacterium sp.]